MATYYWVGGAGTWDAATTTNWALSSGGVGGAGVPTLADNAVFDAASGSTYTVSIVTGAVCNDLTATGTVGASLSLAANAVLDVYGSLTFPATGLTWVGGTSSSVFFLATTVGKTVTTNGVSFGGSGNTSVRFDGVGGGWTLGSALTCNNLTVNQGSFSTANFNITAASTFTGSGTLTRSVSLGSSTVTVQGATAWTFTTTTGLTFNAGTSAITCTATSPTFSGGGLTYNNVSFTSTGSGTSTITGANTFNNLTQVSRSATGIRIVAFAVSQVVTGTLTLGATNTAIRRIIVFGTTSTGTGVGTPITLTVNTVATLADVDFRDITAAGASGTWSGTRLGNCGGNTNITFAAGVTKYWSLAAGGNWSATAWALTSGGAPAANNFPLAQDTVIINNTNLNVGATITFDQAWQVPTLDASTRSNTWTFANTAGGYYYGNITLSAALTGTSTGTIFVAGRTPQTITTAGVTLSSGVNVLNSAGGLTLNGNLTTTANLTVTQGVLDLGSYTLTGNIFSSNGSGIRTFAFGTGKIVLTGNATTVWSTSTTTNLNVTGTPLVELTYAGSTGTRTIAPGILPEVLAISFSVLAGLDVVAHSGTSATYKNLTFAPGFGGTFVLGNSQVVYGNVTLGATMTWTDSGNTTTFSGTLGTQTITSSGVTWGGNFTTNAVGATVSLADALTLNLNRTLTLGAGTLATNGYSVTTSTFNSNNSLLRTLDLGASTVTILGTGTSWNITDPTNITLNAGTSTLVFTGTAAGVTFQGGNLTYATVVLPAGTAQTFTVGGSNTYSNLILPAPAAASRRLVTFSGVHTITGALTCLSGGVANSRNRINTSATGVTVSFVIAAVGILEDVDFQDIAVTGTAAPISGTRLGNMGGNSGITFGAGVTKYWNKPAGGLWSDDAWALSSGGAVSPNNFPLAQDPVVLDNTGVGAGTTITMQYGWAFGGLNAATLTNVVLIDWTPIVGGSNWICGDVVLSSAVTSTGTGTATIALTGKRDGTPMLVTSAGAVWGTAIINLVPVAPNILQLQDDLTAGNATITQLSAGAVDLNGNNLTTAVFDGTTGVNPIRSIAFNGGQINITGFNNTVWACEDLTNFSYTGTPTVNFTYSGSVGTRTVANGSTAGATEFNVVDINVTAGTDTFTFVTASSMRDLTYGPGFTGVGTTGATSLIYGNLTLSPGQTIASSGNSSTFAATSGVKTITTNGVPIDRPLVFNGIGGTWGLQDALVVGSTRSLGLYAGTLTTNGYNVTCGRFTAAANVATANRTLNMGSSTFTCTGTSGTTSSWYVENGAYTLTINAGTSTIVLAEPYTGLSTQNFGGDFGDIFTFYNLVYSGNQPSVIAGNNTFNSITVSAYPMTLSFRAGNTQTVNQFNVSGTSGNSTVLNSDAPGSQWYLVKNTGGKALVSNCTISDSAATPAGYWFAPTSLGNVDAGNNTGWSFTSDGQNSGFMLLI